MASRLTVTQEMLVRIQPPQHNPIGDDMADKDTGLKAYDFFFTVRSYGSSPDHAFQELQELFESSIGNLYHAIVDYAQVPVEEAKREAAKLLAEYAEETILETMDPAEA